MKRFTTFLGALALSTTTAMAAPVTIEFDGAVTNVDLDLVSTGGFGVGTDFIASLTFDTTAIGTDQPNGTFFALDDFSVRFATGQILIGVADPGRNIRVLDRALGDQIGVSASLPFLDNLAGMTLKLSSDVAPSDFFPDSTLASLVTFAEAGTLANDISQGNFDVSTLSGSSVFGECDGIFGCSFLGDVTTIRVVEPVAAVPLPTSSLLLLAGLGGLGIATRRKTTA